MAKKLPKKLSLKKALASTAKHCNIGIEQCKRGNLSVCNEARGCFAALHDVAGMLGQVKQEIAAFKKFSMLTDIIQGATVAAPRAAPSGRRINF